MQRCQVTAVPTHKTPMHSEDSVPDGVFGLEGLPGGRQRALLPTPSFCLSEAEEMQQSEPLTS